MKNKIWYCIGFLLLIPFPALLTAIIFELREIVPEWLVSTPLYFWIMVAMFFTGCTILIVLMVTEHRRQDSELQRFDTQRRIEQLNHAYSAWDVNDEAE